MRTWLVSFNEELCDHVSAIKVLGFISWKMRRNANIKVGDVVYAVMTHRAAELDAIGYKMSVTKVGEPRQDLAFWTRTWQGRGANDNTLRLVLVKAYGSDARLTVDALIEHGGFRGLQAIQSPKCLDNDPRLKAYIESVCK